MKKKICFILIMTSCLPVYLFPIDDLYPPITPPIPWDTYLPNYNPTPRLLNSHSRDFVPVSPIASSLGIFGNIPVGNYTGKIDLNLPLYILQYKELTVPIMAVYDSMGNKPDNLPGLIGFCWALQAGGYISKITNGSPDLGPIETGVGSGGTGTGQIIQMALDHRQQAKDDEDWINFPYSQFKSFIDSPHHGVMQHNVHPDKYVFNFNGHVGSFYEQEKDVFKIQSKDGEYFTIRRSIEMVDVEPDPDSEAYEILNQSVKFELIDSKGIKYTFGTKEYTEYSMAGLSAFHSNSEYARCPTGWVLSSIESPNGYKIEFIYEPYTTVLKKQFTDLVFYETSTGGIEEPNIAKAMNNQKWTRIEGFVIKEIRTPSGKIVFDISNNIAQFSYPVVPPNSYWRYGLDNHIFKRHFPSNPELDRWVDDGADLMPPNAKGFSVYENEKKTKEIEFEYPDYEKYLSRSRLYLLGIKDKINEEVFTYLYKFEYNAGANSLPDNYFSLQTDHYGFYNALHTDFLDRPELYYLFRTRDKEKIDSLRNAINISKESDDFYSQASLLTKVIYPTGGYSKFTYEGHHYGRKFNTWPFEVQENPGNTALQTGGSRVKRIENYDKNNNKLNEKIYHYVKDFREGGSISSGVLAYTPEYLEYFKSIRWYYDIGWNRQDSKGALYFLRLASDNLYPLTNHGPHISYSEVTIEEPGNGFTTYKYKNYDNGYGDRQPKCYGASDAAQEFKDIEFWKNDPGISMELERGLLISSETFDNAKNIKKKIEYTYNDSEERFKKDNIRYVRYEPNSLQLTYKKSCRLSTGVVYTYFPYVKEKQETTYFDLNGEQREVVQKESYVYDDSLRLLKSVRAFNSTQDEYLTEYFYTADQDTTQFLISDMIRRGMYSSLFEKRVTTPDNNVEKNVYEYRNNLNQAQVPLLYAAKTQFADNSIRTDEVVPHYDIMGNPLEINRSANENTCIIWGYKGQYPVAKIQNATYNQVLNILGEKAIEDLLNSVDLPDYYINQPVVHLGNTSF